MTFYYSILSLQSNPPFITSILCSCCCPFYPSTTTTTLRKLIDALELSTYTPTTFSRTKTCEFLPFMSDFRFFFIIESIEIVRKLCENCNEIFLHRLRRLLCPLNEIYFLQSTVHFRKRSVKLCLCHASFDKENSIYFSDSSGNFFFFFFFLKRFF